MGFEMNVVRFQLYI